MRLVATFRTSLNEENDMRQSVVLLYQHRCRIDAEFG
jgi:hypothetical protein